MADRPDVKTRQLTRAEFAFLPDPRTRAAFESVFQDVTQTLPDASEGNSQAAQAAMEQANIATANAATAQATAVAAQTNVDLVESQAFVSIGPAPDLPNSRELVAVAPLVLSDGGAGAQVELSIAPLCAILPADVTDSSASFIDATGLLLPLEAGAVYDLSALLVFQSAATTTGIGITFTLPAGSTIRGAWQHNDSATTVQGSYNVTAGLVAGDTTAAPAAATDTPLTGRWLVTTSATAGNAQLRFRTGVAASAVTLVTGSMLRADRLL